MRKNTTSVLLSTLSHSMLILILLMILVPMRLEKPPRRPVQISLPEFGNTTEHVDDDLFDEALSESVKEIEQNRPIDSISSIIETIGIGNVEETNKKEPKKTSESIDSREIVEILSNIKTEYKKPARVYSNRISDGRGVAAGKYGGNDLTESAVENGLSWLSKHQSPDGKWDSNHYKYICKLCNESGLASYDPAQTGLALLAFLGAGYYSGGDYEDAVRNGIDFLIDQQNRNGSIGNGDMYNHSIATLAIAEAYGIGRDTRLKDILYGAIEFIEIAQQDSGGWTYTSNPRIERNDSSITGFVVMALKSAEVAGIYVNKKLYIGAIKHFKKHTKSDNMVKYADVGPINSRRGNALVAVGLFTRIILGQDVDDREIRNASRILISNPPTWSKRSSLDNSMYYWYYGSLAMFCVGGYEWDYWNRKMVKAIVDNQVKHGHLRGSWKPDSKWGPNGGRLYSTSINVLTLETYYRYVPEYLTSDSSKLRRYWE